MHLANSMIISSGFPY